MAQRRIVFVNDSDGYERPHIYHVDQSQLPHKLPKLDIGRVLDLRVSPKEDLIALTNHRHELILVNLQSHELQVLDKSPAAHISTPAWSSDGKWLAYTFSPHSLASIIKVANVKTSKTRAVTKELKADYSPSFDPDGRYLYFLSTRDFFPVYDSTHFDLGFPTSARPYLIPLRKDIPSPFIKRPKPVHSQAKAADKSANTNSSSNGTEESKAAKANGFDIDFDGIESRILAFPVDEGRFGQVVGIKNRVLFSRYHVRGIRPNFNFMDEKTESGWLIAYDLEEQRAANFVRELSSFRVASDNRTLVYRLHKHNVRVTDGGAALPAEGAEPSNPAWEYSRKAGWVHLNRAKILIQPQLEWKQMYEEAWRLQSEQFWDAKMSDVDWQLVHDRYEKLIPRLRTRSDLSDIIWEMQGELGTSHAYEFGGDYSHPPHYPRGFLGANLSWHKSKKAYKVDRIIRGDSWSAEVDSPLALPGLNIKEGDFLHAIDGREVSEDFSVDELLLNKAGAEIDLLTSSDGKEKRHVTVRTLHSERMLRYRNWVETNRKQISEQSKGKIGYIHIPDMGPFGYAEFHRSYLAEYDRDGIIVDVRYNRGGHVSALLLEKLVRKRVGYDCSRWGLPTAYPLESVKGPMVAVTNQFAGSDGDIFSHCFKLFKLGPLVGKRTWGGVIGIEPRHRLVDGTLTTQPEFSFWFQDVGFKVENYGTNPDYEVDIAPEDYANGIDPQLNQALALVLQELKTKRPLVPDFTTKPSLKLPFSKPEAAQTKTTPGKAARTQTKPAKAVKPAKKRTNRR